MSAFPASVQSTQSTLPSTTAATQSSSSKYALTTDQPSGSFVTAGSNVTPATRSSSTTPSGGSSALLRLREIAQKSQKLNETIRAGSAELPKLDLSLGIIREKAREMSRRAGGVGRENMQQAYIVYLVPDLRVGISYWLHLD